MREFPLWSYACYVYKNTREARAVARGPEFKLPYCQKSTKEPRLVISKKRRRLNEGLGLALGDAGPATPS
jgi:hypothetical protein